MRFFDDNGRAVSPSYGSTMAPIKIGTVGDKAAGMEIHSMLTYLEATVEVAADGTVTVSLYADSVRNALAEMKRG